MASKRATAISGILLGDELGLVKRIDMHSTPTTDSVVTLNRDNIKGDLTPDKSVISIRPFVSHAIAVQEEDSSDSDEDNKKPKLPPANLHNQELSLLYLIASKPNVIQIYNSMTNAFTKINPPVNDEKMNLVGAQPINRNNIVVVYDNGTIYIQNIEMELLESSSETNKKAIRLLGINFEVEKPSEKETKKNGRKRDKSRDKKLKTATSEETGDENNAEIGKNGHLTKGAVSGTPRTTSESSEIVYNPQWNTSNTCITCFEVCANRLAVAGKNLDLKVFNLDTKQCILDAKSGGKDWLGMKSPTWVTDVSWIGPILPPRSNPSAFAHKIHAAQTPAMIATCSKTDSIVRIFDVKCSKKPIWNINLKDSTLNNESNPPSFTSITSTCSPLTSAVPTQQLILGTSMGRMIAIDLRFNSKSHRQLGVFTGFGGGAIRDISFVPNCGSNGNHKIVSCSLDRFVRVHTFRTGANHKKQLDSKFYVKTRPTCIQPIISSYMVNDGGSGSEFDSLAHIEDSDVEFDDNDD